MRICCILLCRLRLYSYSEVLFFCCLSQLWDLYHSNINQPNLYQNYLKMSKEHYLNSPSSLPRKKYCKSTDLKRRLFEVGIVHHPNSFLPPPIFNSTLTEHLKRPYDINKPLKYHPSNSPTIHKHNSKDFQIRKSPKQVGLASSKSKDNMSVTMSKFSKADAVIDSKQLKSMLINLRNKEWSSDQCRQESQTVELKLDEYVNLILRGAEHIDQFLYLVRGAQENIYQLNLVNFQYVRLHEGQPHFQYYTVSKKGFCQYIGGKPQTFLQLLDWSQQKQLYLKIKALKFFYRFRRWKTLQMWRRTVIRQRREIISHNLSEKMFLLEPITRRTLLELRKLTIAMEHSVLIIARNQGTYSLESFKHCQEKARREASLAVEEYSRQSRAIVRKCFENRLAQLRQNLKKSSSEEKTLSGVSQSPKEGAFQALGFPSKMTYEHRSRLRKQAGKFLRFSYLIDSLNLSSLTDVYATQVSKFIGQLELSQYQEGIKLREGLEVGKEEAQRQKMFIIQLMCNFKEVPSRLKTTLEQEEWSPFSNIRLKQEESVLKQFVSKLSDHWLSLQPNFDQILDELGFLLKEGLGSLKCFERWSRHREMQKYVSILQQWDDFVSDNWQVSQNDNLDPLILLDSIDPSLKKLKEILKFTEKQFVQYIREVLNKLLNSYWQYTESSLHKLYDHSLLNPSDTFENILTHTTFLHEQVSHKVPHRLQLGLFTIQITKLKNILGQKFASVLQNLRRKLPELVEQRTAILNQWFTIYGSRLKEEILNIDDFVKIVDVLKDIDQFSSDKREECNEMAQTYQIMQHFKIDTRKRKDFQSVTLKLKDQLDQLIITAEQNIERKTDVYSREVLKYHLPSLAKDISKALEKVEQPKFLLFSASQAEMLEQLETLKRDEEKLFQQNERCQKYICALKLQPNVLEELNTLSAKINSRIKLWKSLSEWQAVSKQHEHKNVKEMPLKELINTVNEFKNTSAQLTEDLPANEVLQYLSSSINQYAIYLPMLLGFNEQLSQSHWAEIYAVLPEKYVLDLKRREFSMGEFLRSGIGGHSYAIQTIFQRCKIEFKLQKTYQQLQESWGNISARTKVEGRFSIIANPEDLRAQINQILISITQLISNQYAQSLRQYSITYESMLSAQENLETWIRTQEKMVEIDRQCRVLDMKKLADYNYFQNAERAYKQISKPMLSKGAESGVRLNKLLAANMEEKFAQINSNLQHIEANIDNILEQHKRAFPSFLLFSNKQLLSLITDHSDHNIEWAARALVPFISQLQFENERITSIVSMDQDKLIKNPISTNSDIEQILYQIVETTAELNRKSLKSCKYKAIENNLSSLVEHYNIQHLLAISRVDFSYYTTISIENQVETADSLSQFRKVMRKDTMEEMKGRVGRVGSDSGKKSVNWIKYDSLLLQQLFYQQVLEQLIRKNVQRCEEFQWALQLKFYWEDNNSEESNITIRQLHLNLKYGNQFIGSQTKVIIQNEPQALLGLKLAQNTLYNASINTAERLLNAAGYKLNAFPCSEETCWLSIRNFIIGSHFADFVPFLLQADLLSNTALNQLSTQKWLEQFKENTLKKNSPYLKEAQRITAVYFNVRQNNIASPSFQGLMRVVNYNPLKTSLLLCYMRLFGIYSQQKTRLLLSLFESAGQLQQKGRMKNISLQQFLDSLLCEEQPIEDRIFSLALSYLKCKVNPETYAAIQKQLECLGVLAMQKWGLQEESKAGTLVEGLLQRRMVIVSGRGQSKKWFIGRELSRRSMKMIQIFGKNIDNQSLINQDVYAFLQDILKSHSIGLTESAVLYFEAVSLPTLHAFEKLVYGRQDIKQRFMQSSIYILIDLSTLQAHINPKLMTSFAIFNYEESKDYIHSFVDQKLSALEEESRRSVEKVILEIVLPTIETLNPKDQLAVEQKVISFLSFLFTLIPFTNPLEACLYSLIQTYKSSEEEQIKLQHMLKKYIGEERLAENNKITQFLYSKEIPAQGLITQQQFLSHWLDNNQRNLAFNQYVITPEIAHLLHTLQNINTHTHLTPIIEGTSNTGKSTIFNLFRSINHQNTFFMHIVAEGSKWNEKLSSSLQRHGLNILGAKVTFMQTLIMVDDVHLADKHSLIPLEYMINYNRCNIQQQQFTLKKVRFALSSSQTQTFKGQKYLRIFLNGSRQKVHGIFVAALRQSMGKEWSLQDGLLKRMVEGSMQLCRKVLGEKEGQCKIAFLILKRVIGGFKGLKIKESGFEKQIEKYWAFSLRQALKSYSEPAHLEQELYKMDLSSYSLTPLSYTHLTSKPTEKKVEFLKDSKRLYNMLNEKIEKYNEGQIKRYGENFEFLNFDSVIEKIVTISHSLLLGQDHFLVGRKGSGKESLVKLSAYLNGMLYRHAAHSLKQAVIDILNNHSSPHIFYKQLHNQQDVSALQQYMCADFQSEILAVMDNRPKSSPKDKERMLPLRSTHIRNTPNNQYFTTPKTKLTLEEVLTYKKSFRIIVSTNTLQNALAISPKIRAQFYLDLTSEVPIPSILQYNEKLLAVDGVTCAKSAHLALSEIYDYSREHLGISLRGNDDCVRIFSSFLANLISEMTSEAQKYKRVLCLFNKLNRCCLVIQDEVGQLHSQLKELLQSSEVSKEGKMEIEWKLRQKSTCLSVGEKLCQILGWVQSLYTQRQRSLSGYLSVKQNIEITFAVTAGIDKNIDIFLKILNRFYHNQEGQKHTFLIVHPSLQKILFKNIITLPFWLQSIISLQVHLSQLK